jgi:hypothetical protein
VRASQSPSRFSVSRFWPESNAAGPRLPACRLDDHLSPGLRRRVFRRCLASCTVRGSPRPQEKWMKRGSAEDAGSNAA